MGIGERNEEISIPDDPSWSVLVEENTVLVVEPFETFKENVRLEFENNQAFSELFA